MSTADDRVPRREADTPPSAHWLRRALRLASLSSGATWPNPGVGCVIVRDGRVLGEGRHRVCGQEHAEVAALADCRRRGEDPIGATVYVTLAPCTRQGRQPPCTDALRAARVAQVVAGLADPHQDDAGTILAAAGIGYTVLNDPAAVHLHGGFVTRTRLGRPRLTGKWAMTLDGCIATDGGASAWISHPLALARSRRRRRAYDGILVGRGTAQQDDPALLTPRGRRPDGSGPQRLLLTRGAAPVAGRLAQGAVPALTIGPHGALRSADDSAPAIAAALGAHGLNDVLVEGGAQVHAAFLAAGLYDRLEVYLAGRTLGGGLGPAGLRGAPTIAAGAGWTLEEPPIMLGDTCVMHWCRSPPG